MLLEDYDVHQTLKANLISNTRITAHESTEDVRELVFSVAGAGFSYQVGQSIAVLVPGPHNIGQKRHMRLYSLADTPDSSQQSICTIVVRRCFSIDEYSGEKYPGIASNYLCDLKPNDDFVFAGPYGIPFPIPENKQSNILMIGSGTGIAPFRAFVKLIYKQIGNWQGKVRLFYGAHTGLELLYMNDMKNDFANYYDEKTFKAFQAISTRPHWDEHPEQGHVLAQNKEEVWDMICHPYTHVYIAGLLNQSGKLDAFFQTMAKSEQEWSQHKHEMIKAGRWMELLY